MLKQQKLGINSYLQNPRGNVSFITGESSTVYETTTFKI